MAEGGIDGVSIPAGMVPWCRHQGLRRTPGMVECNASHVQVTDNQAGSSHLSLSNESNSAENGGSPTNGPLNKVHKG